MTHSLSIGGGDPPPIPTSQVESMAREVQTIFPHMPIDAIVTDLQVGHERDITRVGSGVVACLKCARVNISVHKSVHESLTYAYERNR